MIFLATCAVMFYIIVACFATVWAIGKLLLFGDWVDKRLGSLVAIVAFSVGLTLWAATWAQVAHSILRLVKG